LINVLCNPLDVSEALTML